MTDTLTSPEKRDLQTAKTPVYFFDAEGSRFDYAIDDLQRTFSRPKLMWSLIKTAFFLRYQGTLLGGLWVTLTTGATIAGLATLYSQIFGASLKEYFPYVALGLVVWGLMTTIINDGASVFLAAAGTFTQSPVPKSLFVIKSLGVAAIGLAYKLVVVTLVIIGVGLQPSLTDIATALLGVALIFWTGFWLALGLGTLGARFRDVGQLVAAVITFAFFVTPVIWEPSRLGEYQWVAFYNPLAHFINIVRGPIMGLEGVGMSFIWACSSSAFITVAGALVFGYFARRLCYWS